VTGVPQPAQPIFFYDLGSPACYLAAERIIGELPAAPEWEPAQAELLVEQQRTNRSIWHRRAGGILALHLHSAYRRGNFH
jgi:hypothetical protein